MSAPAHEIIQKQYQNPHASMPLLIPMLLVCNTPDDVLAANVRANSAEYHNWVKLEDAHDGVAIMVGGGGSVVDHIDEIRALEKAGGQTFAINGAAKFLGGHGIWVHGQVMADAQPSSIVHVDNSATFHFMASQCHPDTIAAVKGVVTLWHLEVGEIEQYFPPERVKAGGYCLIGGGAATGNSAMCLAYALGYRKFEVFGYDSCHTVDGNSHAYPQPMNDLIPTVDIEWSGKTYTASVAMKSQAEKFQMTAAALKQAGCEITVHGEGLLQAMYNTDVKDMAERDKYRLMWQFDAYRDFSPGEQLVDEFMERMDPDSLVIDFGCGTGRASVELNKRGVDVFLTDFVDSCRDTAAQALPFLEWDLCRPMPASAEYGLCTDVLEHIPTEDVDTVIKNIMESARTVFFQVSTVKDSFGDMLETQLHLTVRPHDWWLEKFRELGYSVEWSEERDGAMVAIVWNLNEKSILAA